MLGDYAFAVWDKRKRALFCARDHAGARPLYYAHENGQFAFASAVEAVLAIAGMPDALDETMVATHLGGTRCSDARRVKPLATSDARTIGVRRSQLRRLRHGHLAQRIEGWAASGASRGIEYRYPLLDRRLLEFALGMPPEQFQRGEWRRWLMRERLRTVLPPEVRSHRGKRDPARSDPLIDAWCAALPTIRQRLAASPPLRAGYVDMAKLDECLARPERFRAQPGRALRALHFLDFQADA